MKTNANHIVTPICFLMKKKKISRLSWLMNFKVNSLWFQDFFEFVKCCRISISAPTVCNNFRWDFGHIRSLAGQGKLYVQLIVTTHVVTENVSDEESSLETSTLGSTTTSSCDIRNMNYPSSWTNIMHSPNTSPAEPQQYLPQTYITSNIESTNNTERMGVGLLHTTDDIHTLVNQLLDA